MSTDLLDEDAVTEHWTYTGRRPGSPISKPLHVFLDAEGRTRSFTGKVMRSPAIGAVYAIKVWHRDEDRVTVILDGAAYVDRHADKDEVAEWRLADLAAATAMEADRAAVRLARDNGNLDALTLGHLRDLMRRQPAHLRRGTLAAINEWLLR